jgi:diadenosine tetraphosphatase ApaH/serine/threonine PP2A family protein phosphatase
MKTRGLLILTGLLVIGLAACSGGDKQEGDAEVAAKADLVPNAATLAAEEERAAQCRAATQKLGGALKTKLKAAVSEGGPLNAVNVCHDEAQAIAERICDEEGLTVGRTSRKFRNPANAPDEWEMAGLEEFSERLAAGEKGEDLEMWATVTGPGGARTFRYLKAIPTGPLCLACHGSELPPELDQKLVELYPDVHARGFAVGDLRGAFTVKMDLPRSE